MHTSNRCEENIDTALLVIINCINISGFVFCDSLRRDFCLLTRARIKSEALGKTGEKITLARSLHYFESFNLESHFVLSRVLTFPLAERM